MFKTIRRIINWVKPYRKRLYLGFLCSFFSSWCTAAPVMIAAWALEKIIRDSSSEEALDPNLAWLTLTAIAVTILLRFFFSYWKNRLQESIGTEQVAKDRLEIGDMLKRVSLGYFSKNNIGDILAALTTELSVLELHGMKMIDRVINGYIQVLAVVSVIALVSPLTAVMALAGVLLSGAALHRIGKESQKTAPIAHEAQEKLSGAAVEYVRGLPVVKSFGQEGVSIDRFYQASKENRIIRIKNEFGFVPWNCLHLLLLKAASMGLVLITGIQTVRGEIALSVLIMMVMFSFTIFGSVEAISDAAHLLSVIDAVLDRIKELRSTDYIDESGKDIPLEEFDIEFQNVTFSYDQREVIGDVSFSIPRNSTTAIVGPSGGGKSTICNLIARFYDVDMGAVKIGGHDVREFSCNSLMKNISMVFQTVYLFQDTVYNNIKFGRPDAAKEEIIAAAKAARCHEFISALPQGYDTVIGEGGNTLSGGEKQRISIARAMLKDAPIIILDEATASIDPENEHEIQKAISTLVAGKTLITIAHRLVTIEQADQILVVSDGQVVQTGSHQKLIEQQGIYQDYVQIRRNTEGWSLSPDGN